MQVRFTLADTTLAADAATLSEGRRAGADYGASFETSDRFAWKAMGAAEHKLSVSSAPVNEHCGAARCVSRRKEPFLQGHPVRGLDGHVLPRSIEIVGHFGGSRRVDGDVFMMEVAVFGG